MLAKMIPINNEPTKISTISDLLRPINTVYPTFYAKCIFNTDDT